MEGVAYTEEEARTKNTLRKKALITLVSKTVPEISRGNNSDNQYFGGVEGLQPSTERQKGKKHRSLFLGTLTSFILASTDI